MDALRKQVASGATDTTNFWRQVAQKGTPLVEPVEKDAQHQLVTFLWAGTSLTLALNETGVPDTTLPQPIPAIPKTQ
jgi:hypothetical protein